ncbi:Glyoxalase [Paramixta manurensis]|uniref:Glyoxalase n=1 Tax=Paramixta manurensis TaxID=2740817 RepID=A0A6M8U477_9GAMM|nr:Glyoxalase [Erwiniaceae bacterium PD-1]
MRCIGVILSGCGGLDGSELYETVLTLLAIERAGASAIFLAPEMAQPHVINHITGEQQSEVRQVLVEAARLARGKVFPIGDADPAQLDALIVPGGLGAAKILSDFALAGKNAVIERNLQKLTREIYKQSKPIGLIGIASVLGTKIADTAVRLTIGTDSELAEVIEEMGAIYVPCPGDDIVVDAEHKIITTPAGLLTGSLSETAQGIDKLVKHVMDMTA